MAPFQGVFMASKNTENTVAGDTLIIEMLSKYMNWDKSNKKLMLEMASHGVIAVETLLELAISKVGNLQRSNEDGEDFVDGSDAKKATVYNQDTNRVAWIGNIKKNGVLRTVVADPEINEIFYFKIPQSITECYNNKRDMMTIPFSFNGGKPERMQFAKTPWIIWNECRVNNFEELCV